MTFDKRLMDLYCSTRADLCPCCGVELSGPDRRLLPMYWDHYVDPSRYECGPCGFRFAIQHQDGRAVSVEVEAEDVR